MLIDCEVFDTLSLKLFLLQVEMSGAGMRVNESFLMQDQSKKNKVPEIYSISTATGKGLNYKYQLKHILKIPSNLFACHSIRVTFHEF